MAALTNTEERLLAENASLREREKRLQDFIDAASDYFWEMDENLRFSYFSERFVAVTGLPINQFLGKTRAETGLERDIEPKIWRQHLEDLAEHRPFRNFDHPRTRPDNKIIYLSVSGTPIFDGQGTFKGYRGIGRDITKRIEAEKTANYAQN